MVKRKIIPIVLFIIILVCVISKNVLATSFADTHSESYFTDNGSSVNIVKNYSTKYERRLTGISGNNTPRFDIGSGGNHLSIGSGTWTNFWCMQHTQNIDDDGAVEGKMYGRIIFNKDSIHVDKYDQDGDKSKDKFKDKDLDYSVEKSYFMSYILTLSGEKVNNSNMEHNNLTQQLIWVRDGTVRTFLNSLKDKFNDGISDAKKKWDLIDFTTSGSAGNLNDKNTKIVKAYGQEADAYQSFCRTYKEITSDVTLKDTNFKDNNAIFGSCIVTYSYKESPGYDDDKDNIHISKKKFGDILFDNITLKGKKQNNSEITIPKEEWCICNSTGKALTKITSGTEFYVSVNLDYIKNKNIKSIKLEIPYKRLYCTADLFLRVNGNGSQLTSILGEGKSEYITTSTSLEFETNFGWLTIKKQDALTGTKLSGYKVSLKNSQGEYFDQNGNNKGKTSTSFTIDSTDGIKIKLPPGTYTVTEVNAPSGYDTNLQVHGQDGVITTDTKTVELLGNEESTLKNVKYVGLVIKKQDSESGKAIENMQFTIKDNDMNNYINAQGQHVSSPAVLTTDSNGLITITKIAVSKLGEDSNGFTIQEYNSNNNYYKTDKTVSETIVFDNNGKIMGTNSNTIIIKNEPSYSMKISKIDPDDPDNNDPDESELKAKFRVEYIEGNTTTYMYVTKDGVADYSNSKNTVIEVNGSLEIQRVKRGKYRIYETEAPKGIDLSKQDNYNSTTEEAYLGEFTIDDNSPELKVIAKNYKYINKITGYVWYEDPQIKGQKYNNKYEPNIGDKKLSGIKVQLINKNDPNTIIPEDTTDDQGKYEFLFNREIKYWELQNYYVRFIYDNKTYVTVPVTVEYEKDDKYSRAIEKETTEVELDDRNLTGTTGNHYGEAVTNPDASDNEDSLAIYYNEDTYSIETINLGLMKKPDVSYSISEQIEYVKLVKGDYTFKYSYGPDAEPIIDPDANVDTGSSTVKKQSDFISTVTMQASSRRFIQKLYPSDITENIATGSNEYQVYVVYKITVITNQLEHNNEEDLYVEEALCLDSLTSYFDTNRYELCTNENGDEENSSDFSNWDSGAEGEAKFNIHNSDKAFKDGIGPKESESAYIQFKVKDNALKDLLKENREQNVKCPTTAETWAYHKYKRNDSSWKDDYQDEYEHRTDSAKNVDNGLSLELQLAETRTIEGSVFEDTKVETDANNADRKNERIGNGKYDEGEKSLSGVVVSLVEFVKQSDGSIKEETATLYRGLKNNGDTWEVDAGPAVQKVQENGRYSLGGVTVGEYYLKFTYGNGEVSYTDLNGEEITEISTKIEDANATNINSNKYKSTILTGPAKNATDENKNWYLENIGTNNNIATDILIGATGLADARLNSANINTELNNTTQNSPDPTITAVSPKMRINFEYLPNNTAKHNDMLINNATGMSFGIIERPHIEVELKKNISNIKLTLQNGTSIINETPTQNVSPYVTDLDNHGSGDLDSAESGYAKLEMESSNLYSSAIEITYLIQAINNSEVDYATEKYYKTGEIDTAETVKTIVSRIIDYIPKESIYGNVVEITENNAASTLNSQELTSLEKLPNGENNFVNGNEYFTEEAYQTNGSDNYKKLQITTNKQLESLKIKNAVDDANTLKYEIKVNKLLNDNEEDMGLTTYSEIIGIKNIPLTPQYQLKQGNYIIGDEDTHEADDDSATFVITPSTGENRDYTIYIIVVATLILAVGVGISIKKYLK